VYLKNARAISRARGQVNHGSLVWPDPPIEAVDNILPLLSVEALQSEGKELGHCIDIYKGRIFQGTYYAYRLQGKCRCTVGIEYSRGSWLIDQVRGKSNEKITDPEILMLLKEWLSLAPGLNAHRSLQLNYLNEISRICSLPLKGIS